MFDDSHISLDDATYFGPVVPKFLDGLTPTERVGIFSASGQLTHEFTSDKETLKRVLDGLIPRPKYVPRFPECPDISYYEADQIVNQSNQQVFSVAVDEALQCRYGGIQTRLERREHWCR
jgi:hypothetical protein